MASGLYYTGAALLFFETRGRSLTQTSMRVPGHEIEVLDRYLFGIPSTSSSLGSCPTL